MEIIIFSYKSKHVPSRWTKFQPPNYKVFWRAKYTKSNVYLRLDKLPIMTFRHVTDANRNKEIPKYIIS